MPATWFVRGGGKVYGPLDAAQLKRLAVEGEIDQRTEVARNAGGPWHCAGNVRGLFAAPESIASNPPPAAETIPAKATLRGAQVLRGYQSWRGRSAAYLASASAACALALCWGAWVFFATAKKADTRLADAHPKAFERGLEAGRQAGRERVGSEMPGESGLEDLAKTAAEKAIPSNTALIGSGSDEEREAYAQAFIQEFSIGYEEEKPLRLKRARERGEDEGHQAGFLWAKVGKKEPDDERLAAVATQQAEQAIPSNTALIDSGSDEERRQYVSGFVSQFLIGYRKAN